MTVPFTFLELKESDFRTPPLSPQVFSQDEDSIKYELPYTKVPEFPPGTYILGQSSKEGTFRKRVREDLNEQKDPLEPPALKRQNAIKIERVDYGIACEAKEDEFHLIEGSTPKPYADGLYRIPVRIEEESKEVEYIPMPGNKDYDKKPSYYHKNKSPFGNYIFDYTLNRKAPNVDDFEAQRTYRQQMLDDMEFIRRLLYDYEMHIDYNGCRQDRLKSYCILDQLFHIHQLETLPQPTGDEICMNPPPVDTSSDECFHVSPFGIATCDNLLHDHNSK
jgi:hypothetical protein